LFLNITIPGISSENTGPFGTDPCHLSPDPEGLFIAPAFSGTETAI
jgi:hypothetical protein